MQIQSYAIHQNSSATLCLAATLATGHWPWLRDILSRVSEARGPQSRKCRQGRGESCPPATSKLWDEWNIIKSGVDSKFRGLPTENTGSNHHQPRLNCPSWFSQEVVLFPRPKQSQFNFRPCKSLLVPDPICYNYYSETFPKPSLPGLQGFSIFFYVFSHSLPYKVPSIDNYVHCT